MANATFGKIIWTDLTVPNAGQVRDFYANVVGLTSQDVPVDDHTDYTLTAADGSPVVGVCHALGDNAALPPQWLVYFSVADLDASLKEVEARGGKRLTGIRGGGGVRFCVIQDPAGAVCALMEMGAPT